MLNVLKQARSAFALLNPDEVRARANQPVRIGLVASGLAAYDAMESLLAPQPGALVFRAGDPDAPDKVEIVLYEPGLQAAEGAYTLDVADPGVAIQAITHDHEDLILALARQFPIFRHTVIHSIIHSVARENALFAVATALPDVIPNLMELPWAFGEWASDTAFLTANQVRMAFLIAAACGKDVGLAQQKFEILTIGAGAFGWRAIARELVGKIPLGGGLIPKGGIAYAGTYVVGKGLERVHNGHGEFTRIQRQDVYKQALEHGKSLVSSLLPNISRP